MDELIKTLAQYGAPGLIACGQVYYVQGLQKTINNITDKLFIALENNTRVMAELQKIIEHCQNLHERK